MFSPRSNLNLSLVAEQVNQKDKILEFLRARNFLNELKQNCIYFDSKLRRENESENFEPFLVNFHLRFGEVEDGEFPYTSSLYVRLTHKIPQQQFYISSRRNRNSSRLYLLKLSFAG